MTEEVVFEDVDPHKKEWLKVPVVHDKREPIRVTMRASDGSITLSNLTPKELEAVDSFVAGASALRLVAGRLAATKNFAALPTPVDDPILSPYWKTNGTIEKIGELPGEGWRSPGFVIQCVGAGHSDPVEYRRAYRRDAGRLEEMGFVCMRSQRNESGRYWEAFVLFSTWQAKGELRDYLQHVKKREGSTWKHEVEALADYIGSRTSIRFGTLDVVVQRWALSNDD